MDTYCRNKFICGFPILHPNAEIVVGRHYKFFRVQLLTKSKKAPCVFRCTEFFYHKICINYRKKPKLLTIAGSFAFPEQIWKKEIIFITHKITCNIGNAIQPRIGIIITKTDRIETTVILRACLTWNIVYFDE